MNVPMGRYECGCFMHVWMCECVQKDNTLQSTHAIEPDIVETDDLFEPSDILEFTE